MMPYDIISWYYDAIYNDQIWQVLTWLDTSRFHNYRSIISCHLITNIHPQSIMLFWIKRSLIFANTFMNIYVFYECERKINRSDLHKSCFIVSEKMTTLRLQQCQCQWQWLAMAMPMLWLYRFHFYGIMPLPLTASRPGTVTNEYDFHNSALFLHNMFGLKSHNQCLALA